MVRTALRWLASSVALLFVVTALTFILSSIAPGDAATAILSSQSGSYTPEQVEHMRHLLGVDQPLWVRYGEWLTGLTHGSLGTDLFSGEPVTDIIAARLAPSLSLVLGTVIAAGLVGTGLGVASARRSVGLVRAGWGSGLAGRLVDVASLLGFAVPSFWLALVLIELFAVRWGLFPPGGYVDPGIDVGGWLAGMVLPVVTLAAGAVAFVAKQTRDSMSDVLGQEYITMLRARGLSERSIVYKHALRNAAIPVVTMLGLTLVNLLSGAVVIEGIFFIPGLGERAVVATSDHNLPVITGIAFCFTLVVVTTNLLVDLAYRALNPRVRHS